MLPLMQPEALVGKGAGLAGAAHLKLVEGVTYLDPKSALLEAMLSGCLPRQSS
ncbi:MULTISPECIES: hypothetical protein [unclassified Nonomuraea]|uniref:hypothetical protein n=1 Tax=unclassified Nonomuraea TaxID=2593643 RepID=UPI0013774C1B|nr:MULTISPECIES: hypothetical protein [unclassified Nonomuraea]NBE99779.1 hypothetical protein [Nonomuraea sp. K271]